MEIPGDILPKMTHGKQYKAFRAYIGPLVHTNGGVKLESVTEAYAIVSFTIGEKDKKTFCVKNDSGIHAEWKVIETLEDVLPKKPERVEIYLNYSPCNEKECCIKLIEFQKKQKEKNKDFTITISFANLYNIIRPGCGECKHPKLKNENISKKNKDGLIALNKKVQLRTFTPDDWDFVADVLSKGNSQDVEKLLGMKQTLELPGQTATQGQGQEKLRDREDQRMNNDLTDILRVQEGNT